MYDMIGRVAKALLECNGGLWECASDGTKEEFEVQARAALTVMREPDEAMTRKAWEMVGSNLRYEEVYRHMIDAALAETQV